MATKRDPRHDPEVGDVLKLGSKRRRVIEVRRRMPDEPVNEVIFIRSDRHGKAQGAAWIWQWRIWSEDATVEVTAR